MKLKKSTFWTAQRLLLVSLGLIIAATMIFNLYIFSPGRLSSLYGTTNEELEESADLIVVGFSQVGSESVWRTANTNSIQGALTKDNGFLLLFSNGRQKQENQIKSVREYISQKVDYIVLSPVTSDGWETVLSEAKAAGIPVIIVDRMVNVQDQSLYTAFVGTDMYNEGRKAAVWLEEYCKEEELTEEDLNIVILAGTAGSSAETGRTAGFMDVARTHRHWHILDSRDADFTTSKGKEIMQEYLEAYEDIDVLVSQNDDMTFGAVEAMDEAGITHGEGGDIAIVSFDGVKEALIMLRDGQINADVECNPLQGEYVAELIKKLEAGEEVDRKNYIEEKLFTKYNVNAYINSRSY